MIYKLTIQYISAPALTVNIANTKTH